MTVKELKEFLENVPDDAICLVLENVCTVKGKIYYKDLELEYEPKTNDVVFS